MSKQIEGPIHNEEPQKTEPTPDSSVDAKGRPSPPGSKNEANDSLIRGFQIGAFVWSNAFFGMSILEHFGDYTTQTGPIELAATGGTLLYLAIAKKLKQ